MIFKSELNQHRIFLSLTITLFHWIIIVLLITVKLLWNNPYCIKCHKNKGDLDMIEKEKEKERERESTAVTLLLATDHPALTLPHLTHWGTALLDSCCVCVCVSVSVCVYMHQLHLTFTPTRICKTDHTQYTSKHTPGFLFLLHTHTLQDPSLAPYTSESQ